MSEVAPPPPKRPTIIRQNLGNGERSGPPVPVRPAPPVPPGSASASSKEDAPTPSPKPQLPIQRPSVTRPSKTDDDLPPVRTRNHATKPSRPVSVSVAKTSDNVRRRPEITIVAARPMSEVGFRGDLSAAKPAEKITEEMIGIDKKDNQKSDIPVPKIPPRKDIPLQRSQSAKPPPVRPPHVPKGHPSSVSHKKVPSSTVVPNESLLLDSDIPDKAASEILVPINSSVETPVSQDKIDQSEGSEVKPRPKPAERPRAPHQRPVSSLANLGKPSPPPTRTPPPRVPPPKVSPQTEIKESNEGSEKDELSPQTVQQDAQVTQSTESKEKTVKKSPPSKPLKPPVSKPAPVRRAPPKPQPVDKSTLSEPSSSLVSAPIELSSQTLAHEEQNQAVENQDKSASPVYAAISQPVSKRPTIIRPASMGASNSDEKTKTEEVQKEPSSDNTKADTGDSEVEEVPPIPARHYNDADGQDVNDTISDDSKVKSRDVSNTSVSKPVVKTKPSVVGRPKSFSLTETASKFEASSEQHAKQEANEQCSPPFLAPKPKPKPTVLAKPRSSSMPTEKSSNDTDIDHSKTSHPLPGSNVGDKEIGTGNVETRKPERPTIIRPPPKPKRTLTDDSSERPMVSSDDFQIPDVKHSPSPVLSKRPVSVMYPPGHANVLKLEPLSDIKKEEEQKESRESSKKPDRPMKQPVSTSPAKPPHKPSLPSTSPAGHKAMRSSELPSDSEMCTDDTPKDPGPTKSTNKPQLPSRSPSCKPVEVHSENKDSDSKLPAVPTKQTKEVHSENTDSDSKLQSVPSKPPAKPPLPSTKSQENTMSSSIEKSHALSDEDSPMQSSETSKHLPKKPLVPVSSPAVQSSASTMGTNTTDELATQSVVPSKPPPPVKSPVSVTNPVSSENLAGETTSCEMESIEKDISKKSELPSHPPPPQHQRTNNSGSSTSTLQEEEQKMDQSKLDKPDAPSRPSKGPVRPAPKPSGKEREEIKKTDKPPARPAVPQRESPPELPSRPGPGHPLYHYMLSTPHGIALHDFSASHQDELSLKVNEVVVLLKRVDDSWLMGQIGNRQGIFPQDFLAVQIPLPGELPPSSMVMNTDEISENVWEEVGYHEEIQEKIDTVGKGPRCCARFDFEGGGAGDLQFEEGDYIKILERVDAEWLRGELQGKVGIFPISFVEIIEDLPVDRSSPHNDFNQEHAGSSTDQNLHVPTSSSNENTKVEEQSHIHQDFHQAEFSAMVLHNHKGGPGELSLQFGDYVKLSHRISEDWLYGEIHGQKGKFPANIIDEIPPGLPQEGGSQPYPSPKGTTQGTTYCLALYDFQSNDSGDLSFIAGDKIEIIEKLGDDWLKGKLKGREGMFPTNFVKLEAGEENSPSNNSANPKPVFIIDSPQTSDDIAATGTALYDFVGQNDSELSFKAGDIIILGDHVPGAEEWRIGELNGHQGMFPASFVN